MTAQLTIEPENSFYNTITTLKSYFESPETYKRILLISSVVLSVLSLVPILRIPAAIALRAVACISSTVLVIDSATNPNEQSRYLRVALDVVKSAVVALGLAGLIVGSPMLIIASLTIETAMQGLSSIKAFFFDQDEERDLRGSIHLGLFIVGALTLSAIAVGGWPLIVAAALVNIFVMGGIFGRLIWEVIEMDGKVPNENTSGKAFDAICYLALAPISLLGGYMFSPKENINPITRNEISKAPLSGGVFTTRETSYNTEREDYRKLESQYPPMIVC